MFSYFLHIDPSATTTMTTPDEETFRNKLAETSFSLISSHDTLSTDQCRMIERISAGQNTDDDPSPTLLKLSTMNLQTLPVTPPGDRRANILAEMEETHYALPNEDDGVSIHYEMTDGSI